MSARAEQALTGDRLKCATRLVWAIFNTHEARLSPRRVVTDPIVLEELRVLFPDVRVIPEQLHVRIPVDVSADDKKPDTCGICSEDLPPLGSSTTRSATQVVDALRCVVYGAVWPLLGSDKPVRLHVSAATVASLKNGVLVERTVTAEHDFVSSVLLPVLRQRPFPFITCAACGNDFQREHAFLGSDVCSEDCMWGARGMGTDRGSCTDRDEWLAVERQLAAAGDEFARAVVAKLEPKSTRQRSRGKVTA